ncbi:hypothetical protein SR870_21200 [Rhodopseudomonas palustris]|uniref:hypothetical protein n=1 Tax=Rhodopseudomonas palustris TaxID=1076 RepID=UPI002ACD7784|nr:hypothetical protein [Rhodopseudomonas palustris]WQG99162.1 hypothetical protein SR870_21200 [Rhodopseudomonas palustris]
MRRDLERVSARRLGRRAARIVLAAAIGGSVLATPAWSQSFTDRFKNLFGGGSSDPAPTTSNGAPAAETDLTCPSVSIRSGAATYAVGLPGKEASGNDLRYQVVIGRTARECNLNSGMITAHIGIQGRVIAGPAGAPENVDVPVRVAVVQDGVSPKTVFTKAYRTNVAMGSNGNVPFSLVMEDVVYPAPSADVNDAYVFYIGFDPQALKPEPRSRRR